MGSLASRPSVPAPQPQVVFVPAPAVTTTQTTGTTNTSGSTSTGGTDTAPSDEALASEARTSNLLQRSRGRFGTVQTSFRGLLSAASSAGQRKTLLGE